MDHQTIDESCVGILIVRQSSYMCENHPNAPWIHRGLVPTGGGWLPNYPIREWISQLKHLELTPLDSGRLWGPLDCSPGLRCRSDCLPGASHSCGCGSIPRDGTVGCSLAYILQISTSRRFRRLCRRSLPVQPPTTIYSRQVPNTPQSEFAWFICFSNWTEIIWSICKGI